jgi:hypothetical protein
LTSSSPQEATIGSRSKHLLRNNQVWRSRSPVLAIRRCSIFAQRWTMRVLDLPWHRPAAHLKLISSAVTHSWMGTTTRGSTISSWLDLPSADSASRDPSTAAANLSADRYDLNPTGGSTPCIHPRHRQTLFRPRTIPPRKETRPRSRLRTVIEVVVLPSPQPRPRSSNCATCS